MTNNILNKLLKVLLVFGILGLLFLFYINRSSGPFYLDYLSVYGYFISLSIGATFLILLMYLTRAGWGVVIKRVPEHLMSLLPIYALLFIPILFGLDHIFEWLDPSHIAHDPLIQAKLPYLNLEFFVVRNIIYFVVFSVVSSFYWKNSIRQDNSNKEESSEITKNLQRKSPLAILLMSLVTSFASFDWLMSLYPHWFSTIFGIYYFAGCMVFVLAVTILIYEILLRYNLVKDYPNTEHFHDLSKLLYGFVIFWSYVSFSQYFLTWYANIPEFTQWYYPRLIGEWKILFFTLIVLHFLLPLFGFMSRHVKRSSIGRISFCILFIIIHYLDIRFIVYPNFTEVNSISINEYLLLIVFSLIIIPLISFKILKYKILPENDPRYSESKKLENAL
tara:strand:+ start:6439 stop:7608 length:1170 start_codon:yes stop_codon:yes gene_type:complete